MMQRLILHWLRRPCKVDILRRTLISNASNRETLTIEETTEKLKLLVGERTRCGSSTADSLFAPVATSQDDIPPRTMAHSFRKVVIPLGTNPMVKEKYINFYQGIRFGRILEDLDMFAVAICYVHSHDPVHRDMNSPLNIVTALVDRIVLSEQPILPDRDIRMQGKVTWAGKTSMEVTMKLDQEIDQSWKQLLEAKFVMVARNAATKSVAVINKLIPEGPEEEALFKLGEETKAQRMLESQKTLLKTPPDENERLLIHNLFLETLDPKASTFKVRVKPERSVWMEDTIVKKLVICFPEERNLYNKIFGGFLMRKAFELAYANACFHCKGNAKVLVVDNIAFKKSVEIGSFLFLSSQVVYTLDNQMMVKVHAEVVNPKDDSRETTNDLYFLFAAQTTEVPRVIPKSYAESMLYLDGKRHFDFVKDNWSQGSNVNGQFPQV
ncbi:acyl-coenzyme A thioesterase 9, mitochondrial-like [Dreissena polymorpha]|uniref:acyl-coenzyme A thioesterase 9, mitochondrial-like n=1 Tax=Dreissena polymorpha TaxID=45954 RepID=UPI0022651EEC|nr:acyl-coenzyme A thioesterase 9, mitochondrial-like [Dreissena polymorpha]